MEERSAAVTLHGNPLTLMGTVLNVGDAVPDIEVLDNDLNAVKFSSFKGKICVISAVPSLDTPTCDMETRRFNETASQLGDDVVGDDQISFMLDAARLGWDGISPFEFLFETQDGVAGGQGDHLVGQAELLQADEAEPAATTDDLGVTGEPLHADPASPNADTEPEPAILAAGAASSGTPTTPTAETEIHAERPADA